MGNDKFTKTRTPGIYTRNGTYYLRKQYLGEKIQGATGLKVGPGQLEKARQILDHQMEQIRNAKKLGVRRVPYFYEAAAAYIKAKGHLKQIANTTATMERLLVYIGEIPIDEVHQAHPQLLQLVDDLRAGTTPWQHGRDHFNNDSAPKPRKRKTIWAYL